MRWWLIVENEKDLSNYQDTLCMVKMFFLWYRKAFAVWKLVYNVKLHIAVQFVGLGRSFVTYVNVAMMCMERLILFHLPKFYIRNII